MTNAIGNQRRIAIIGGGPGGLTLAIILKRHGIDAVVYEREAFPGRHQGGSLDIHHDSGQRALQEAGLFEAFQTLARYEGEDFVLVDKTGRVYMEEVSDEAEPGQRPEIDRGALVKLLTDAADPAAIRWAHKLLEAVPLGGGRHELRFENGAVDTVDLVVGADGAFSKVRPLLTDAVPAYSGLTMVEIGVDAAAHPALAAFNKRGKMFALSDRKGILGQLNGDGRIRVYLSFETGRDWLDTCGIPFDRPELAKPRLLELFDDWSETLKDYIRLSDGPIVPRRIYMLPVGLEWAHRRGATLIGDAGHVMSPFAGEGVNLAMRDAMELALAIVRHDDIDEGIAQYERSMYGYSSEAAQMSYDNLLLSFGDDAAANMADLMNAYAEQAQA